MKLYEELELKAEWWVAMVIEVVDELWNQTLRATTRINSIYGHMTARSKLWNEMGKKIDHSEADCYLCLLEAKIQEEEEKLAA